MINLMCFCSLLTIACYFRQLMGGTSPPSQIVGFLIFATGNLAACLSADWHAAGATTALRQVRLACVCVCVCVCVYVCVCVCVVLPRVFEVTASVSRSRWLCRMRN